MAETNESKHVRIKIKASSPYGKPNVVKVIQPYTSKLSDSDRRKELVRIPKPWYKIEELVNMTDFELYDRWIELCNGDEET